MRNPFRRKKPISQDDEVVINDDTEENVLDQFFPPQKLLTPEDLTLLSALKKELEVTGVIDVNTKEIVPMTSEDDLETILTEAIQAAQSERELNPSYYNYDLEEEMLARNQEEDWDNPSLDGIDDYGIKVYDDIIISEASIDDDEIIIPVSPKTFSDEIITSGNKKHAVQVQLPDGRIISGNIV